MNEQNMVKRISFLTTGDGFRKHKDVKLNDVRDADGTTLTTGTVPVLAALETSFIGLSVAANQTYLGTLQFVIPEDYDESKNELRLRFLCNSAGTTNAPTLAATLYVKRAGVALATKTQKTSAAISKTSATTGAAWTEINLDSLSLLPGDSIFAVMVTAAHTTDAVSVYALELYYRSNLAFSTLDNR